MRFLQRSLMGLFLLALTLGILAIAGLSLRDAVRERLAQKPPAFKARERVYAVNVLTARRQSATPVIKTFGEIRSRRILDVRAPVAGTVIELGQNFVEGGRVAKGDLLLRLDPSDALSALASVRTDQSAAKDELRQAQDALLLARDDVAGAEAQRALRKAALVRKRALAKRGAGTEAAVQTAALAEAAAAQMVLAKRQALAQAVARVSRAKTSLARIQLRLSDAERRLANTTIRAEFDGVLGSVNAIKGGVIGRNERLARLIDPKALEVVFRVSNAQFYRLVSRTKGQVSGRVRVQIEGTEGGTTLPGVMDRVGAEVGTGETGRQIFARLRATAARLLRSGDFVTVSVDEPPLSNVAVLPATAVGADGNILVLGKDNRLKSRHVTVLRKQGDRVLVRGENLFGREVVKTRSPLLGTGIQIKPLREKVTTQASAPAMIRLTPERRATLVGFVKQSKHIPQDAKARLLARLKQDQVPADMVKRIESRIGG